VESAVVLFSALVSRPRGIWWCALYSRVPESANISINVRSSPIYLSIQQILKSELTQRKKTYAEIRRTVELNAMRMDDIEAIA
jgi:hypothetical protein